jgi:hypothetical protein
MSSTLQISLKNTFLSFSDSPRPNFRRARTTASLVGSESSYSLSPMCSPLALSTSSDERTKVLDSYVASVGQCPQTTVMVRGIPKNYDQEMLLAEVQEEGLSVNFLYLPPGKSKANRSYGFINFETEFAAEKFLRSFQGHQWRQTIVPKFANAGMATLQGYDQNIEFFSKLEVAAGVSKRSPWVKHY